VKGLVEKINVSSKRMSTLIKELLNFSKVLHTEAIFKQTDLNNILDDVLSDFDLLIAEKNVVFNREPLPVIDTIPIQMNQLFYNLIGNAIKFSKDGIAPVITITSKMLTVEEMAKHANVNPKYAYFEIGVKDNGIGFDQRYENQLFLAFHRLHSQEKYEGTGIGLALCKNIVSNHHGEISATSKENEGALFTVILPLTR
jgi:two-component system CheB/CheR fusion protein